MSILSGCQPQQMYQAMSRDFYPAHHHRPQPPTPQQQQPQQQQRYLPSMETLSAAAAGLHGVPGLNSSPNSAAGLDAAGNAGPVAAAAAAYFPNLMFTSQYNPDYSSAGFSSTLPPVGTELTLAPAAEPYVHSNPSNLYMGYDEIPLMIPTGNGVVHHDDGCVPRVRTVKRRVSSNRKERRRTHSINTAFAALRGCIPNVPSDTKLSKIKTLRLATSYIAYLMDILNKDDPKLAEGGFKADISRKIESREEKRKRESEEILKAISAHGDEKPSRGRTGWPQQVWAAELKQ